MTHFQASDEGTHPAGTHEHWNESFYLNCFDPRQSLGAVSRIAFSPNQGFADGFVCLYFPDGATGFLRTWESRADHGGRNSAGGIEHACLDPFRKWRVRYRGPIHYFEDPARMADFSRTMLADTVRKEIEIDLHFEALHDVFDFHASMRREWLTGTELLAKLRPRYFFQHLGPALRKIALVRTMSGAQHYEHAGRITGEIRVDGRTHPVEGLGQRDHSWGVRDMRVPANWRWFSGQLGPDLCFNAIKVEVLAFRASGGYVFHDGRLEPLTNWSYEAEVAGPLRGPERVSLVLVGASGKRLEIAGEILTNLPVLAPAGGQLVVVNEAHTRFRCGAREGHGISEFMEQLAR